MTTAATNDSLYLVETAERIFIHPSTFRAGDRFVVINRVTDEITVSTDSNLIQDRDRIRTRSICGVLGVLRLIAGPYLVFITSRERVGEIIDRGNTIWRITNFEMIPFRKSLLHLNEKQKRFNSTYLDMIKTVLDTPYFYYSNTYDLSQNMQTLNSSPPSSKTQSLVERADPRFVWNNVLLQNFHHGRNELRSFCVPIIHGFVGVNKTQVNNKQFQFILISRRSCKRPGCRLACRGIDEDGNVANFVETEQIIEYGNEVSSFVQIRGSIPLFWTQKPNLRYKPKPTLQPLNHSEAFVKHFEDLVVRYERITSVNLVNQSGSEAVLEIGFKDQHNLASLAAAHYEAFDFHHECRNMNWDRLQILINRLSDDVDRFGYFMRGNHSKSQEGVFRTNCVDCLDRTNVVQGMLARLNVERALTTLGIFSQGEKVSDHSDFEYLFKNLWADNGDIVSTEYSGTGALKSDFTRTGKRTFTGVLRDGWNSGIRYLKNNFADGFRQDAMDLFVGNYIVNEKEGLQTKCPLEKNRDWKYLTLPTLLVMSLVMLLSVLMFPQDNLTENRLYMLFWASMATACTSVMVYYGTEFVDNPVLSEDSPRLTM